MSSTLPLTRTTCAALLLVSLTGCASLSPDSNVSDINAVVTGKIFGVTADVAARDKVATREAVSKLLRQPVTADTAVCIALLNNPALHASMARLEISDADRVQAATLPNPHFSFAKSADGDKVGFERGLVFNVVGLISLPWRGNWQNQQHEAAKLAAAQSVIKLATDTRMAWINAVAAQQSVAYKSDVKVAAEAGGELARRMSRVGNWSRLDQAREQLFLADANAQLARAQLTAFSEREKLTRLMGLWGAQTQFKLVDRLPDLPTKPNDINNIEERALRERLDVRSAVNEAETQANALGMVKLAGFVGAAEIAFRRKTTFDNAHGEREREREWEFELPLPIFDWGGAANAKARATYQQSLAKVREVAINARSEARDAYHGYRTAYDLAVNYRDEVVPLRKFIHNETLLRYNGMLLSVFDLLGDMRMQIGAVNLTLDAQRDFWLADARLQTTLTGMSMGAMSSVGASGGGGGGAGDAKPGH